MTTYSKLGLTLLKPGSMLPESTTTTGDSLPVTHINPFHIISAEVTIIPGKKKFKNKIYLFPFLYHQQICIELQQNKQ